MIVEVIIYAPPRSPVLKPGRGNGAEICKVIVGQEQCQVFKTFPLVKTFSGLVAVVVIFYFLIESEHLGAAFKTVLREDLLLVRDGLLKKVYVVLHGRIFAQDLAVALAAHTDSNEVLIFASRLDGIRPELIQAARIGVVAPVLAVTYFIAVRHHVRELFSGSYQRLVMRRSHRDAELVCEHCGSLRESLAVVVEYGRPHRRPHEVAAQPQQQVEDLLVEQFVEVTESIRDPSAQRRPVVIQEEPSVLDLRFTGHYRKHPVFESDMLALGRFDITEIMPRGHAYHLRQLIQTINGAELIRARDNEYALAGKLRDACRFCEGIDFSSA